MDGWNASFLLGFGLFSGAFAVSFREGIVSLSGISPVLSCTPLDLCILEIGDIRDW